MLIDGQQFRSLWYDDARAQLMIIDQTRLPFTFDIVPLADLDAICTAIITMQVRGAPLIGATAAYGLALALRDEAGDEVLQRATERLLATRPTAVNLHWAVQQLADEMRRTPVGQRAETALAMAHRIADSDVTTNRAIGQHGAALLRELAAKKTGQPLNILTHCNAGALATVDLGTALAPIYQAASEGIAVHVWVDETRPRNQGASLTAWELGQRGIAHTLIADNAGGHLMQHGQVDICLVGSDRTTASGDVCNKIGTYLKALAAHDNGIPFYACLPVSTIDWQLQDGLRDIPIEERSAREVTHICGIGDDGRVQTVRIAPTGCAAANPAFDVTPARLVTGLITEYGVFAPNDKSLQQLREHANGAQR